MRGKAFVSMVIGAAVAQVAHAGTDYVYYSSGAWSASPISAAGDYAALASNAGQANNFFAAKPGGGVENLVYVGDGAWSVTPVSDASYIAMTAARITANTFMAAKPSGGTELVAYAGDGVWNTSPINDASYNAIAAVATNDYEFIASKTGGGSELVWYVGDGAWTSAGIDSESYQALATDAVRRYDFYGAKTQGGLQHVFYAGDGAWGSAVINENSYVALTSDVARGYELYGARAGGGLDYIYYASGWITTPISSNAYTALAYDGVNSFQLYGSSASVIVTDATWALDGDGNWSEAANWTGGVPNAPGATARFLGAIGAPHTVTVDVPVVAGKLVFDNTNTYTIAGTATLGLSDPAAARIDVLNGSHVISAPLALVGNTTINVAGGADTLTLSSQVATSPGVTITKAGAGNLVMKNLRADGLAVDAGAVKVAPSATANDFEGTSSIKTLSIQTGASLDLANNSAVIDYTGASVQDDIRQALADGRILSSSADANKKLGYGEASATGFANGTFAGQAVDADAVLIKFTYGGDSNLDGKVDVGDLGNLASNWQQSAPWTGGDFDYNGTVNVGDLGILATNWQQGVTSPTLGPSFQEALAALGLGGVSVPEPAALGIVAMGLSALFARRRRA